ncbi:Bug family tripartite tricarboxylate transporter substrate binding protein [Aquabacterium sp. J223]|uniref:Bug family tripartite tricarboxylate transporter substrate binding protein n=1 Tax=Aquabacterium sp. J223 TaxID=2898431 RepID=UPI0021ADC17E|nr:tripartite tricarboxylate transporter substrate binding protein [Aquabacterium sp. J223]UUX95073.1 tripartite tricarboxylate transporter substrate binding protein [Aquabacterium sp. J223]
MNRRSFHRALALAGLSPLAAFGQPAFPSRPVRLIVPYPAGGSTDFGARLLAERLARVLGQPVSVDNRTGASGALGVSEVAKAAPDGHTLGLTLGDSLINNVALFKTLPYNPQRDLTFLTQTVLSPAIVCANTDLPVKNLADLRRYAADHRGQMSYGSWGVGGLGHIAGEALNQRLDARMVHVPHRGEGPVMNDLLSKTLSIGFTSAGLARQHVQAGKVTPLAIMGRERSKSLPQVPTAREQGFDDPIFDAAVWVGLIAPAGLPAPIAQRWTTEVRTIMAQPEVGALLNERGLEVLNTTPEQFIAHYRGEFDTITRKIRDIGIEQQ